MSKENDNILDAKVQAYLDGELSSSKAAAFEEELRADAVLDRRVAALRGMETWLQATRSRSPSLLASAVEQALEAERFSAVGAGSSTESSVEASPAERDAASSTADSSRGVASGPAAHPASRTGIIPLPVRWRRVVPAALAAAAALAVVFGPLSPDQATRTPDPAEVTLGAGDVGIPMASSETPENTVRYEFLFSAPEAREVCLAGDFNQWKVCETRLTPVGEGVWSVSMEIPRGRHEYMFVVDGQWITDPNAAVTLDDGFGHRNAVLSL